jgi:hypothetical protein
VQRRIYSCVEPFAPTRLSRWMLQTMPFIHPDKMEASYETVVIGSGFGSFYFLHEFLKRRRGGRTLLSSVLPTCGSAPPSLTIAAMSLRAARLLAG